MEDRLILKGMTFFGHHGVTPEEQAVGQRWSVDVELSLDLSEGGGTNDLEKTVDYVQVHSLVKSIVEGKRFRLAEAIAEDIAQSLLRRFEKVRQVRVEVRKANVPLENIEWIGVCITRRRGEAVGK